MTTDDQVEYVPIITQEQGDRIWEAIHTWQRVAREAGKPVEFTLPNVMKSCLLGRMLYEGKPPLPKPPPLAYSAPWYSLIEEGVAHLSDHDVYPLPSGPVVLVCQHRWTVVEPQPNGWLLTNDGDDRWMLRRYMEGEEPGRAGTYADGRPVPATWLFVRRPSLEAETASGEDQ